MAFIIRRQGAFDEVPPQRAKGEEGVECEEAEHSDLPRWCLPSQSGAWTSFRGCNARATCIQEFKYVLFRWDAT
jgi:hypothetical protein